MTAPYIPGGPRSRSTTLPPIPTDYDRLELLYEVQTVLALEDGIERGCDAVLAIITRALRVRTAVLLDVSGDLVRAFTWAADGIAWVAIDEARDRARTTLAEFAPERTESANEVIRAAWLPDSIAEPALSPRHFITLPLALVRGPVFGVFQLEGAVVFHEHDLLFINAVSNQLAVAIDRHRTKLELETIRLRLEHANRRLTDLQTISSSALEGAAVDESLAAVLRTLVPMFGTDIGAVLLASADDRRLRYRATIGLDGIGHEQLPIGADAAGRIAASATAMVFDDLDELDGVSATLRSNGVRSLLGAPMRVQNRVTGVVYVATREHRAFTHDELQFLELVADRIATIIDNASLYDQAIAAVRSRDAVMGVVSHDLRNPLGLIQMCTELLETDDPELARPVAIIKRSVDVMTRLISDLRDVGSIEAGHLSIGVTSEDACALVREAIEGVRDLAVKKPVRLEMRLPERALAIGCDRIRIVQVLTNLLTNAIKFTPQDGRITITVTEEPDRLHFSVEDTGCGIPEDDLPHVFDRYWQAESTAHLGTGLGLAIAKGIVVAHGGTIAVESHVGQGTTFSFVLPRFHPDNTQTAPATVTDARAGARVMGGDDEPDATTAQLGSRVLGLHSAPHHEEIDRSRVLSDLRRAGERMRAGRWQPQGHAEAFREASRRTRRRVEVRATRAAQV